MIVVLADDLSGAAELAGAALRHGLSAEVQCAFDPGTRASVVCVDTNTRSLSVSKAADATAAAARQIRAANPAWIYKKCDSVLRGHVLAEARAIADAIHAPGITVLPANPSRRRVIRAGLYFVDGQPLDRTVFADDPEHPRRTARVADLLGGDLTGIHVPDAAEAADLAVVAARTSPETLPVGAVDFFEALLHVRAPHRQAAAPAREWPAVAGRRLLVCGSAASWASRRDVAGQRGVPFFAMPHVISAVAATLRDSGQAVLGIGDAPVTHGIASPTLAAMLASSVRGVLAIEPVAELLLEGGATAQAVVRALGWNRLSACAVAPAGTGVFTPADQPLPRLYIKPGSYPWPHEIWPR